MDQSRRPDHPLLRPATQGQMALLPEAEQELTTIGRRLGTQGGELRFDEEATEEALKSEELGDVGLLVFATHAIESGPDSSEPALVLTPPETPSGDNDGLLTASEIAALRLEGGTVLLSACNTASGSKSGAGPFTGLARSFLYAGANAVIATQWPVDSQASALLTPKLLDQPMAPASSALRAAQLHMLEDSRWAHPIYWAPFVVVGDGTTPIAALNQPPSCVRERED